MVDHVLVAERDADDTLHHQRLDLVLDERRLTRVGEAAGQPTGQPDHPVGSASSQHAIASASTHRYAPLDSAPNPYSVRGWRQGAVHQANRLV